MGARADRKRLALGAAGFGLVAQLALLRAVTSANDAFVTFAGRPLRWECTFKRAFGIPCPNCGMTRSVVFTLHGEWGRAFRMNPAGPLLVLGAVALGVALLLMAFRQRPAAADFNAPPAARRLALTTALYGALVAAVLLANWVRVIT